MAEPDDIRGRTPSEGIRCGGDNGNGGTGIAVIRYGA